MVFRELKEPIHTSDPWYDITDGGYIKPEEILLYPAEVEKIKEAVKLILTFFEQAEEIGSLEII